MHGGTNVTQDQLCKNCNHIMSYTNSVFAAVDKSGWLL